MTAHPLLDVDEIPGTEPYLRTVGQVFRSFREQDSGCLSTESGSPTAPAGS